MIGLSQTGDISFHFGFFFRFSDLVRGVHLHTPALRWFFNNTKIY